MNMDKQLVIDLDEISLSGIKPYQSRVEDLGILGEWEKRGGKFTRYGPAGFEIQNYSSRVLLIYVFFTRGCKSASESPSGSVGYPGGTMGAFSGEISAGDGGCEAGVLARYEDFISFLDLHNVTYAESESLAVKIVHVRNEERHVNFIYTEDYRTAWCCISSRNDG